MATIDGAATTRSTSSSLKNHPRQLDWHKNTEIKETAYRTKTPEIATHSFINAIGKCFSILRNSKKRPEAHAPSGRSELNSSASSTKTSTLESQKSTLRNASSLYRSIPQLTFESADSVSTSDSEETVSSSLTTFGGEASTSCSSFEWRPDKAISYPRQSKSSSQPTFEKTNSTTNSLNGTLEHPQTANQKKLEKLIQVDGNRLNKTLDPGLARRSHNPDQRTNKELAGNLRISLLAAERSILANQVGTAQPKAAIPEKEALKITDPKPRALSNSKVQPGEAKRENQKNLDRLMPPMEDLQIELQAYYKSLERLERLEDLYLERINTVLMHEAIKVADYPKQQLPHGEPKDLQRNMLIAEGIILKLAHAENVHKEISDRIVLFDKDITALVEKAEHQIANLIIPSKSDD